MFSLFCFCQGTVTFEIQEASPSLFGRPTRVTSVPWIESRNLYVLTSRTGVFNISTNRCVFQHHENKSWNHIFSSCHMVCPLKFRPVWWRSKLLLHHCKCALNYFRIIANTRDVYHESWVFFLIPPFFLTVLTLLFPPQTLGLPVFFAMPHLPCFPWNCGLPGDVSDLDERRCWTISLVWLCAHASSYVCTPFVHICLDVAWSNKILVNGKHDRPAHVCSVLRITTLFSWRWSMWRSQPR